MMRTTSLLWVKQCLALLVTLSPCHLVTLSPCHGGEPCASGPKTGQRPGPYSALVSVGAERGQLHCFICETADRPAVIVFARKLSDPLGNLLRGLDKA